MGTLLNRRRYMGSRGGDWYATDGLKIHYDGIDNTGFGHSNDTDVWFNLADPFRFHGVPSFPERGGTAVITQRWGDNRLSCINTYTTLTTFSIENLQQWTMEMVFSLTTLPTSQAHLFANVQGGGYELVVENGIPKVAVYKNGAYRYSSGQNQISTNTIYSMSGTWDGNELSLYINGVLVDSNTYSAGSTQNPNTVLALFCNPNQYQDLSNTTYGYIYSVRYYNRVLSASEVAHNYGLDDTRFNITENE